MSVMGLYTDTDTQTEHIRPAMHHGAIHFAAHSEELLFVFVTYVQTAVEIVPRPLTTLNDQAKY